MSETQETQAQPKEKTRQMSFSILESGEIVAEFGPGLDPVRFNPAAELPEALFPSAVAEGVVSRARSYGSKLTGDSRTPEALRKAVVACFANLSKGEWKVEREPGAGAEISIEAEAAYLYRKGSFEDKNPGQVYAGTLEDDAKAFASLSEDTKDGDKVVPGQKSKLKATLRYQQAVATIKARRQAERAAKLAAIVKEEEDAF